MKKSVLKIIILVVVFIIGIVSISYLDNQTSTAMTEVMQPSTLPVIHLQNEGLSYNSLYGYLGEIELMYMRDNISQLSAKRELVFNVESFEEEIIKVAYEIRNIDGTRLIENGEIREVNKTFNGVTGTLSLKDLIEVNQEYKLIFIIDTKERKNIQYITRVIWNDNLNLFYHLDFMKFFHEQTFDIEAAISITKYLESNSEGDNSGFQYVDIHSSFNQITWGDLSVEKLIEPLIEITEIDGYTSYGNIKYLVNINNFGEEGIYYVEEKYRIRYTADRMYLLEFERVMNKYFDISQDNYSGNLINLGIVNKKIELVESEGSSIKAFVVNNSLYSYNGSIGSIAEVFSFYVINEPDIRNMYNNHKVKILQVTETGNITYAIYGYMNRGRHEGEIGIQIMEYDSNSNANTELLWIKYAKSSEILQAELDELLYLNGNNQLYMKLEDKIYSINLDTLKLDEIVQFSLDESIYISQNNQMIIYQIGEKINQSEQVKLLNLRNQKMHTILAAENEYIVPLGFIGEDAVIGRVSPFMYMGDDISTQKVEINNEDNLTLIYEINILDIEGNIIKTYAKSGVFITECIVENNQLILEQVQLTASGRYEKISTEYIKNNEVNHSNNNLQTIVTEILQTQVQIKVTASIDEKKLQTKYAESIILERYNEITIDMQEQERYYVYGLDGLEYVYMQPAVAVKKAYEMSGVVIGESGEYVWRKTQRAYSNQIMAIKGVETTDEKNSLVICLDTILKYEGIIRNSEYLIGRGETIQSILEENLENTHVLNLEDCNLDSLLYYINLDLPVLVTLKDGNAVLIIGFNEYNIVLMDPNVGEVFKMGMNDSIMWLEEYIDEAYTYIRY